MIIIIIIVILFIKNINIILYYYFKLLTPVDPAGPDCYQSGTKPCEST